MKKFIAKKNCLKSVIYFSSNIISKKELSKNKTIFFFIYWFKPSGAEYYALECARLAKKAGFDVVWIVENLSDSDDWTVQFKDVSTNIYNIYESTLMENTASWILNLISHYSPSALHIHHSVYAYEHLNLIKSSFPQVVTIDSTHIIELKDEGFPCLSAAVKDALDYRNVISSGLRQYYEERNCDLNTIIDTRIIPDEKKSSLILPSILNNKVKIVILGRLDEQKRPYLFMPFVKELQRLQERKQIDPELKMDVMIYGSGEYQTLLEKQVSDYFHHNIRVAMISNCYDKELIYKDTFCVVQLSENEGISIVSYEALLKGKHFLATDVGQQKEVLFDTSLLPSNAKDAIVSAARTLSKLLQSPNKQQDLLMEQRKSILFLHHKYGYKKIMGEFYNSLMKGI